MKYIANVPFSLRKQATIIILESDSIWEEAYKNWIVGKNPTDSKEWKKGVYFGLDWYGG